MRRSRKTKLITMIALVITIVGMTIGFAAFSRILTISSKATVNPNRETHKLVVYGIDDATVLESMERNEVDFSKLSTTNSFPIVSSGDDYLILFDKSPAIIDNSNFTITNLSAEFSLVFEGVSYYFFIRNEGVNTIYLEDAVYNGEGVCTALDNTTQSLVDQVCDKTLLVPILLDLKTGHSNRLPIALEAGDYMIAMLGLLQQNIEKEIDGRYEVSFEDIQLIFSDVLPEEVIEE